MKHEVRSNGLNYRVEHQVNSVLCKSWFDLVLEQKNKKSDRNVKSNYVYINRLSNYPFFNGSKIRSLLVTTNKSPKNRLALLATKSVETSPSIDDTLLDLMLKYDRFCILQTSLLTYLSSWSTSLHQLSHRRILYLIDHFTQLSLFVFHDVSFVCCSSGFIVVK